MVDLDNDISLDEAKSAIKFCKTFGGRESIGEYLQPLREFLKCFGTLERFDYVLNQTEKALGINLSKEGNIGEVVQPTETKEKV